MRIITILGLFTLLAIWAAPEAQANPGRRGPGLYGASCPSCYRSSCRSYTTIRRAPGYGRCGYRGRTCCTFWYARGHNRCDRRAWGGYGRGR